MNTRTKELFKEAYSHFGHGKYFTQELLAEKFAELLVQDCIRNLEIHATCFDGDVGRGMRTAARLTKEHFGVKK